MIGLAAVAGIGYGLILKRTRPETHARIGQGNEAFQLEKAADAAGRPAGERATTG
ncbi:hypothetical protein ACFQVA_06305 [Actinomadura keratinilytica]